MVTGDLQSRDNCLWRAVNELQILAIHIIWYHFGGALTSDQLQYIVGVYPVFAIDIKIYRYEVLGGHLRLICCKHRYVETNARGAGEFDKCKGDLGR